ncbi:hypothetical protein WR25_14768 [Diploscapter pachys]|uniref:Uncharacterized protein n=1 Tax=Diploscapter pachys TaxID=2018661 RepID=A0A2A2K014_9BILA|nr:hypothetical protein WR25_14768 [Diploscapter pachys]
MGVAEQQAAQDLPVPRHHRYGEVARHLGMARRHAGKGCVGAVAGIAGNVARPDHLVAEDRAQHIGATRAAQPDEVAAFAARQREQVQPFAAVVHDVMEERADRRAGQLDPGIGDHLYEPFEIVFGRERGVDTVEGGDGAFGATFLRHVLHRHADAGELARAVADRQPVLPPHTGAVGAGHLQPLDRFARQHPGGERYGRVGAVGRDLAHGARDMIGDRHAAEPCEAIVHPDVAQIGIEDGEPDRRCRIHRRKLFGRMRLRPRMPHSTLNPRRRLPSEPHAQRRQALSVMRPAGPFAGAADVGPFQRQCRA